MKLNLKELSITRIDGSDEVIDVSREVANVLYFRATDIGTLEVCRKIYDVGEAELNASAVADIKNILSSGCLTAVVAQGIVKQLNQQEA